MEIQPPRSDNPPLNPIYNPSSEQNQLIRDNPLWSDDSSGFPDVPSDMCPTPITLRKDSDCGGRWRSVRNETLSSSMLEGKGGSLEENALQPIHPSGSKTTDGKTIRETRSCRAIQNASGVVIPGSDDGAEQNFHVISQTEYLYP